MADYWLKTVGTTKMKGVVNALKDAEGLMVLLEKEKAEGEDKKACLWGTDADQREWNTTKG